MRRASTPSRESVRISKSRPRPWPQDENRTSAFPKNHTDAAPSDNWSAYRRKRRDLLRSHRGEYAWVVGGKVRAVSADRADLCREILAHKGAERGVVVKITNESAPIWEIPAPEIDVVPSENVKGCA